MNESMKVPFVDLGAQYKDQRDQILSEVDRVCSSGMYILGPDVEKFEKNFAKLSQVKHAISVANGTDALMIALKALGVGPGDEVITAPNSWISSASCIALVGATPVFADVRKDQNIDPEEIKKKITPRTKAIIPVYLTGRCADMNPICEIAKEHGLFVIEDAAQAVSASYFGKMAGTIGDIACFSLHPLKNLNGIGDGGVITTNDDALAEQMTLMRNHGIKDRDNIVMWGHNSRLDALQAAILNVRLEILEEVIEKRRKNVAFYERELKDLVFCPPEEKGYFNVYQLYVIQCDRRDELQAYLQSSGIETKVHYPVPLHLNPFAEYLGYKKGDFPVTEEQSQRILSLPIHQHVTEEQAKYVVQKIRSFYQRL